MDDASLSIVRDFLASDPRRQRLLWKLAREEAEKIIRPLVRAEIERIAPNFATEYAEAAVEAVRTGRHSDYNLREAAQRAMARAIENIEFVARVKTEAPRG